MAQKALRDEGPAPEGRSQAGEGESDPTSTLSDDVIFHILQNHRRRRALRWLDEWDGRGTVGPLAEHIAAEEENVTIDELTSSQRSRVYIALYQNHLPKLADCGVITYDQSRGTVELTDAADDAFHYLELAREGSAERTDQNGRRSIATAVTSWLMPWR